GNVDVCGNKNSGGFLHSWNEAHDVPTKAPMNSMAVVDKKDFPKSFLA
ncbi:hypothetical protein JL09_g6578, partial [Pichia kudriavzevii]